MPNETIIDATRSGFADYHNRIQAGNNWIDLRFRASRPLQSAELNEMQTIFLQRLQDLGDSVYQNGTVLEGCVPAITGGANEPNFTVHEGKVYFSGAVGLLPTAVLQIPMVGKVTIGIRYREREITELDDSSLRDPAIGSGNYLEAGSCRRVTQFHWGWVESDESQDAIAVYADDVNWTFFPIYEVVDGMIVVKDAPMVDAATVDLIARYDRESNGNYVVSGLTVDFIEELETQYRFDIKGGVANILGYKINRSFGERLLFTKDPNVLTVTDEPHQFVADAANGNKCIVWFNRTPMANISRLTVVKQKQVEMTRSPVPGGSDELPDASVLSVLSVFQGATLYARPADYTVQGDNINWTPAGAEPAPGSTYTVQYTYSVEVDPYDVDEESVVEVNKDYLVVVGLVADSQLEIDYTYKLPRVDLVVLNRDGTIERIVGTAQRRNPAPPRPADYQIALAEIEYDWTNPPVIRNNAIRAVKMFELESMRQDISRIEDMLALERLKTNIAMSDPAAKNGIFVDSFIDDDLRDNGVEQTASCVGGLLMLPIDGSPVAPSDSAVRGQWQMLPYTLETILEQPYRTNQMRVNPYQAFDPIPGIAKLIPAVDRWTEFNTMWTSPMTRVFRIWSFTRLAITLDVRLLGQWVTRIAFIRVRSVSFEVTGFGPQEQLQTLLFDGVNVTPP